MDKAAYVFLKGYKQCREKYKKLYTFYCIQINYYLVIIILI